MNGILAAICFLSVLVVFVIVIMYFTLGRSSSTVYTSKYFLNKFEIKELHFTVSLFFIFYFTILHEI